MELKVYDGEYFERGNLWYLIFVLVILTVIVLSVLSNNYSGGVIVLLFTAGYLYFSLKTNKTTDIIVGKQALQIGKIAYKWDDLSGFVLEYHTKKNKIHNIVILDNTGNAKIYTIKDSDKNLENFVKELNGYIPILETYKQSGMDKLIRWLKL